MSNIIQNGVKITEDNKITYLVSSHVHHFNTYTFKDGSFYAVDGGTDYARRAHKLDKDREYNIENWCLNDNTEFNIIKDKLLWGTRGKSGKEKLTYKLIKDLELTHLLNIIRDINNGKLAGISEIHLKVIKYWAEVRGKEYLDFVKRTDKK